MWDDATVDDLKKHYKEGLSARASALKLNASHGTAFSRNAVISKLHREGIIVQTERKPARPKGMRHEPRKLGSILRPTRDISAVRAECKMIAEVRPPLNILFEEEHGPIGGVALFDLESHSCRFPIKEADVVGGYLFCGAHKTGDSSYCARHHKRAYSKRLIFGTKMKKGEAL